MTLLSSLTEQPLNDQTIEKITLSVIQAPQLKAQVFWKVAQQRFEQAQFKSGQRFLALAWKQALARPLKFSAPALAQRSGESDVSGRDRLLATIALKYAQLQQPEAARQIQGQVKDPVIQAQIQQSLRCYAPRRQ